MMTAPVIDTARLRLRAHRPDDFAACRALWADPDVVRYIGGLPQDAQAVWFRILRYAGMWSMLGYGMWIVESRDDGTILGEAGLLNAARGLPELEAVPEAGWVLGPEAWGRGIATEAMDAVLRWADDSLDVPSVRCIIAPENGASIGVAHKVGFVHLTDSMLNGQVTRVFDRPRPS